MDGGMGLVYLCLDFGKRGGCMMNSVREHSVALVALIARFIQPQHGAGL